MNCYLCKQNQKCAKSYIEHVKLFHKFESANLKCLVCKPFRFFSKIDSFKKHIQKHFINNSESSSGSNLVKSNDEICNHDLPSSSTKNLQFTETKRSVDTAKANFTKFEEELNEEVANVSSQLYSNENICRSSVQKTIEVYNNFLQSKPFHTAEKLLTDNFTESKILVKDVFQTIRASFSECKTEHLRMKTYKSSNFYLDTKVIKIGERMEKFRSANKFKVILKSVDVNVSCISLKSILQILFEMENFFDTVLSYINSLNSLDEEVIKNLMQTSFWKSKCAYLKNKDMNSLVLPLIIYFDDFETNNPLGSRSGVQNLGGVYVSFPFIPPEQRSKLQMIFPLMLFNSLDRKAYGNRIFDPVISELISLESNGIQFRDHTIYFVLSVCVGDNKGINSMLGFTDSFRSNYWCRFCTLKKDILQKSFTESPSYLRDKINYEIHLKSKSSKETGIVSECTFNVLRDFHAVENYSVDVMHDIFEGILNLEIALIILSYIRTEKYFTIDDINNRINFFDYGHIRNLNRPPQLCFDNLKKLKIRYSASEMMVFSKYLGIIIGDWIPENDCKWELFKILMEIIKIILSDTISNNMISQLEILITEHHKMFVEIFKLPLRPKHHLMLHYPRIIRNIGPLTQVWSMRFESKHKVFKDIAKSTKSRRNICLSILKRYTLKQKTDFETLNISQKIESFGPKIQICSQILKKILNDDKDIEFYKWISFCNVLLKANVVLEIGHNGEYTQYGLVEEIGFSKTSSKVYVFLKKMNTLYYDCNRFCDIVELLNEKKTIILQYGFIKTYNLIHFKSLNMVV